jgi:two-component system, chemotaxis family, chemotaxis protein CheY
VPSKVLVVEDDPSLCEFIREVLSSADLDAHATTDSTQAADRLKTEKFNAAFLDIRMPPPDGIELARQMRTSALNRSTPIIIITGEQERGLTARAFEAGANFLLFKPVDRTKLLRLVRIAQGTIEHEKRRFQRLKVTCRVSIVAGSDRLEGRTLDLSLKGMLLQLGCVLPVGSLVTVTIELLPKTSPICATARVVRQVGHDCIGLELENMDRANGEKLHQFLLPLIVP